MAFSINAYNLPSINSFNQALSIYNDARPLKNNNERDLVKGYDSSKRVSLDTSKQDVLFYYHHTDVVLWHADNTVTIDVGYNSVSTRTFASRLSGHYVSRDKGYQYVCGKAIGARATIKDGVVISGTVPVIKTSIDRKRAKEVMLPWQGVLLHARAIYAMDNNVFTNGINFGRFVIEEHQQPSVEDTHQWVMSFSRYADTYDTFAQRLRNKIYSVANGALVETVVLAA